LGGYVVTTGWVSIGVAFTPLANIFDPEQKRDAYGRWAKAGGATISPPRRKKGLRSDIAREPTTPPPPGKKFDPDVERKDPNTGLTETARVGVPGMTVPPPPPIPKVPNLTNHERRAEREFMNAYHDDPDGMAKSYYDQVLLTARPGEPFTFATDDAKALHRAWSDPTMTLEERSQNRATLNIPLHQTANAIAKRAFLRHLNTLKPGDEVLVTVGGCGAGKGYALKNVPETKEIKVRSRAVWDSAGDQNATENPWIQSEAEKRGLKVNYVYVHADPEKQWADPERGVVARAKDPNDGRMVDHRVYADSHVLGPQNHWKFYQANKDNPNASFVFLDNRGKPTRIDRIPHEALSKDRHALAEYAAQVAEEAPVPPHIKRGALIGQRLWKS
jgi:hypothetical protein